MSPANAGPSATSIWDGTGFDVIREVGPEQMPAVVFVTACDNYRIQAFEVNAMDDLLKPFDDLRLRDSIERAASGWHGRQT